VTARKKQACYPSVKREKCIPDRGEGGWEPKLAMDAPPKLLLREREARLSTK